MSFTSCPPNLKSPTPPPPLPPDILLTFPTPQILLITLNRPYQLNSIPSTHHTPLDALFTWYDHEPSLRCAIFTGTGRSFCAGADLKEWRTSIDTDRLRTAFPPGGFAGLSNRAGKKPVIAAVNGLCLGGGTEIIVNCDLVVAAANARFGLPEVQRGVMAVAGALPRLVRTVGRQRAAEMALLGRTDYTAEQMREWGLVNFVVPKGSDVVAEALKVAREVAGNSPDSVMATREALRIGEEPVGPEMATGIIARGVFGRMSEGKNIREGLVAFVERRTPVWTDSRL